MAGKRDLGVATPLDTIKGWNDKRKSNNQIISSLTPFVQLIGIFDDDEYRKIFASNEKRRHSPHASSKDDTNILGNATSTALCGTACLSLSQVQLCRKPA